MEVKKLGNNGWFIGDFEGAPYRSPLTEVCYRKEPIGPRKPHYHTVCTEILLIINGRAKIHNQEYSNGDIIIWEPGEVNDVDYLVETEVICVKTPAGGNDKVCI